GPAARRQACEERRHARPAGPRPVEVTPFTPNRRPIMAFLSSLGASRLFGGGPPAELPDEPISVVAETLGREHCGKTGIRAMHFRITQQGPQPSGLELSAED